MTSGDDRHKANGASNGAANGAISASTHPQTIDEADDDHDEATIAPSLPEPETATGRRLLDAPPPPQIAELAEACLRFVERVVGVKLDYTLETLPLLDHYLEHARLTIAQKKEGAESLEIVAQAAGAYFGEVVRRRYASWWRLEPDAADHRIELHQVFLTLYPVAMMLEALTLDPSKPAQALGTAGFDLDEEDRAAAAARLNELPEAPIEEFVAPSTRLEVLDIVLDAVRADHLRQGASSLELEPGDYDDAREGPGADD
ncbi:MAG TPA: hypothetical protein VL400_20980 [Polyangiaceae bacterium]|nr:hypothetical protein [Polyangiaceae bacterium]